MNQLTLPGTAGMKTDDTLPTLVEGEGRSRRQRTDVVPGKRAGRVPTGMRRRRDLAQARFESQWQKDLRQIYESQ